MGVEDKQLFWEGEVEGGGGGMVILGKKRNRGLFLLFFFFFFFLAFPSYISGVHHFWVRFLRM